MNSVLSIADVYRASHLLKENSARSSKLDFASLRGQLTEISSHRGHPSVTLAMELLSQTHQAGEPAAWIGPSTSLFYPPDAGGWPIDWQALALLRIDDAHQAARGADKLLRSGAFGLVVVDVAGRADLPSPLLGRLLRLSENHDSAVLFLTQKRAESPSLSSLIALRAQARWTQTDPHRLHAHFAVLKDKRRGPGQKIQEVYDGPLGLC